MNTKGNALKWLYFSGIYIILCLPVLSWSIILNPPDWSKNIIFRSIVAIMLFVFFWKTWNKEKAIQAKEILKKNRIIWLLVAWLGIYLAASIFSPDFLFSFWGSPYRGGGFVNFASYFIFLFLFVLLFDRQDWKKFFDFSIVIGLLVSTIAIIQYFGIFNRIFLQVQSRPSSTLGNPIMLAMYLLLLLFTTIAFVIQEKNKHKKIFYWAAIAIFLFVILITESRAVWLGLLVGAIYFLFFYPATANDKKLKMVKISAACILGLIILCVAYTNTIAEYPKFLSQNRTFHSIIGRLDLKTFLKDPRFAAWQIEFGAIKDRPWLGYGIENLSIGFDKNYDLNIPNLDMDSGWYDKAHNMVLQTASDAGILAAIIYIALFITLLWQFNKEKTILNRALQATLIGYFVANFFSFDVFATYLLFFLIIAYCFMPENKHPKNIIQKQNGLKTASMIFLFLILTLFLWQYNWVPFFENMKINEAEILVKQKKCDQALALIDETIKSKSFIDAFKRLEYNDLAIKCNEFYPEKGIEYFTKGIELVKEALKIQPGYTRYYIFIGETSTLLADQTDDLTQKAQLLDQARNYLNKALELAPKHQEIYLLFAKLEIVAGNYEKSKDYANKCIETYNAGDCYFQLGIANIYLNNLEAAQQIIKTASSRVNIGATDKQLDLLNAYVFIEDYDEIISILERLIFLNPTNPQYHSTLAYVYSRLGEYKKAQQEALVVEQLSRESKENVREFLNAIPQ
jgi:tetratricopeptide (TPR) repeat protein